jgi:hypothetical protein
MITVPCNYLSALAPENAGLENTLAKAAAHAAADYKKLAELSRLSGDYSTARIYEREYQTMVGQSGQPYPKGYEPPQTASHNAPKETKVSTNPFGRKEGNTKQLITSPADMPCATTHWGDWGVCSTSCGPGGVQMRHRRHRIWTRPRNQATSGPPTLFLNPLAHVIPQALLLPDGVRSIQCTKSSLHQVRPCNMFSCPGSLTPAPTPQQASPTPLPLYAGCSRCEAAGLAYICVTLPSMTHQPFSCDPVDAAGKCPYGATKCPRDREPTHIQPISRGLR